MTLIIRKTINDKAAQVFAITSDFDFNNIEEPYSKGRPHKISINDCNALEICLGSSYLLKKHPTSIKPILKTIIETIKYIDHDVKIYYCSELPSLLERLKESDLDDGVPFAYLHIESNIIDMSLFYHMFKYCNPMLMLVEYNGIKYFIEHNIRNMDFVAPTINPYYQINDKSVNYKAFTKIENDFAKKYIKLNFQKFNTCFAFLICAKHMFYIKL